jgi:hypothetical protein
VFFGKKGCYFVGKVKQILVKRETVHCSNLPSYLTNLANQVTYLQVVSLCWFQTLLLFSKGVQCITPGLFTAIKTAIHKSKKPVN